MRGEFANTLLNAPPPPRAEPVKYHQWGDGLDHEAVMRMEKACLLPVSARGNAEALKKFRELGLKI